MPAKIVELTVELLVQAVTCPGVWLCPGGEVSLVVSALGCSHRTARLPPAFPLPYRDAFYFRKIFPNACSLTNLHSALAEETIYCELVQWVSEGEGRVLAQYLGSLADVLFPPDVCSSDGVDLLMKTTPAFPGILSPKIEISTKVRVDEVWDGQRLDISESPARTPSPARSTRDTRRHKPVCHSKPYHNSRCSRSQKSRNKLWQPDRDNEESGFSCPCSPDVEWKDADASVPRTGRSRVAQLLESESGGRRRARSGARSATRSLAHAPGPCVCEICRRYHQLFHIARECSPRR